MANRSKGEVTLRLNDGREFVLVMDFDMRCHVEDLCEKPFLKVAMEAEQGFHRAIRALFWGSLRRHHPDVTLDDAVDLITNHEAEIEAAMIEAVVAAASEEGREKADPTGGRQAMTSSGGNGAKKTSTQKHSGAKRRARSA